MPLVVIAIGGNSITRADQQGTIPEQFANTRETCRNLAELSKAGWDLCLAHGNGPQVGNALRRVELSQHQVYPLPLGVCVADTQGGMGYMLQQVLGNALVRYGLPWTVVTLVTQVVVDADDPAFTNPTKFVGPFYDEATAKERIAEYDWPMRKDADRGWRRVVPSPRPKRIVEIEALRRCLATGLLPIAIGGGGVPVIEEYQRMDGTPTDVPQLRGAEAVIDKDLASAVLAAELEADVLAISTGVPQVYVNYGQPNAEPLHEVSVDALRPLVEAGEFPPGSMGPKIEAALMFLERRRGKGRVIITDPQHLLEAMQNPAVGTQIVA